MVHTSTCLLQVSLDLCFCTKYLHLVALWRCQKLETEMFQVIPATPCPTFLFLCAKAKKISFT